MVSLYGQKVKGIIVKSKKILFSGGNIMRVNLKKTSILIAFLLSLTGCQAQIGKPDNTPNGQGQNQGQVKPNNPPTLDDFAFGNGAGYMRGWNAPNSGTGTPMNNGGAGNGQPNPNGMGAGNGMGMGQGSGQGFQNNDILTQKLTDIKAVENLSDLEKSDLAFMREEEKVARDFYIAMYDKWKQKSFDNISKSEQFHMDAMKFLLDRYKIEDPVGTNGNGVFKDKKLQELYDGLIKEGNTSLEVALKLGAKVEEVDINDLKKSIANTKAEDLKLAYDYLMSASENHLRAFTNNLNRFFNITYTPQILSKEDFDKIVK